MKLLSEEELKPWEQLPKSELQAAVTTMVMKTAIPLHMTKMTLTSDTKEHVRTQKGEAMELPDVGGRFLWRLLQGL